MKRKQQDAPSVRAVLAYAAQLRDRADAAKVRDPHVELYRPSNDAARKVSQSLGPEAALTELARRARKAELAHQDAAQRAAEASQRHVRHQLAAAGERAADRERLSWGERLDAALLALTVAADAPTQRLDADRVSTSRSSGTAPASRHDRRREVLLEDVRIAVERLEREAEHGRRRMVELEAA